MVRDRSWASRIRHEYGITPGEYRKMLTEQNNVCAICERPPQDRRLAVDHNHFSNKVRGLLCFSCNTILGHCSDKISVLKRAVEYLEKYYDPDWDVEVFKKKIEKLDA